MELCLSKMSYIFNVLSSWNFAVGIGNINSFCDCHTVSKHFNMCLGTQNCEIRVYFYLYKY